MASRNGLPHMLSGAAVEDSKVMAARIRYPALLWLAVGRCHVGDGFSNSIFGAAVAI